ncbi:DUF305 domain-containing protein [Candidatus Dependentiae bacterium]|nr:DUF305 domain-containing protein [Candidatus Dependentiae bacterium]
MKYINLLIMALLSFVSMYILMYIMVDSYSNVYLNLNQLYMAGAMTAPMLLIELLLMGSMYTNKKLNAAIILSSTAVLIVLITCVRKQTAITDKEFLKSMIPHHAAALLMCKQNHLQDPELKKLCSTISSTQQQEIDFMKSKLKQKA